LPKAPSGTLGEAGGGPDEEPGQTANRIAESSLQKLAVERASEFYDALTTTTRMVRDKRRRGTIAAEGLLRPTQS
jgi:hypothetical protein